jgi:SAM-dependent methyltransferase
MAPDGLNMVGDAYAGVAGHLAEADLNLGCGVPTQLAALRPGETVLDLGSGAGNDVFIARHEVGTEGRVIGVDMTPDMISRARANASKLGYANVEFRLGEIEHLPIESGSVDAIISNCVLNLLPDKAPAFVEMFRVLRPGGRFCVSDIVATGELAEPVRKVASLYVGCVAGALPETEYLALIATAGFARTRIGKERAVDLSDEVLQPYMSGADIAAFRASGVGLKSVTVLAAKPAESPPVADIADVATRRRDGCLIPGLATARSPGLSRCLNRVPGTAEGWRVAQIEVIDLFHGHAVVNGRGDDIEALGHFAAVVADDLSA